MLTRVMGLWAPLFASLSTVVKERRDTLRDRMCQKVKKWLKREAKTGRKVRNVEKRGA